MRKNEWQPIDTAPTDGRMVWVRRMFQGRLVKEGWAVFGQRSENSPMRKPFDMGRYGWLPADHAEADIPRWCNPDRMYLFPTPTEWLPRRPRQDNGGEK